MEITMQTRLGGEVQAASFLKRNKNYALKIETPASKGPKKKIFHFYEDGTEFFTLSCVLGICEVHPHLDFCWPRWYEMRMEAGRWSYVRRATRKDDFQFELETYSGDKAHKRTVNILGKPVSGDCDGNCELKLPRDLEARLEPFRPVLDELNRRYEEETRTVIDWDLAGRECPPEEPYARAGRLLCKIGVVFAVVGCCIATEGVGCPICAVGGGALAGLC